MVKRLLLVTGLSGAGKSTAMSILEDLGYHCMDQFPKELMEDLFRLLRTTEEKEYDYLALSMSLDDFVETYEAVRDSRIDYQVLLLKASDQALITRYHATHHMHPMIAQGKASSLQEAIRYEQGILDNFPFVDRKAEVDTGPMSVVELQTTLSRLYSLSSGTGGLTVKFESFGYKHGIPADADFVFDMRPLPNPYWVPDLRSHTGEDEDVYEYVISPEKSRKYLSRMTDFLDSAFAEYEKKGKTYLVVGIGCTGGRHRSIAVVNYLMKKYSEKYKCYKENRDGKSEG